MWTSTFLWLLVLSSSVPATANEFVGQVVCSQCWFEADRTEVPYGTPGDLDCAARCSAQGVPPALAVRRDGGFELLLLEGEHDWLKLVGRFARVRGTPAEREGEPTLQVASLELLEESPWAAAADEPEPAALSWTDLVGNAQDLEAFRGRIVVLNFWATWCEPCREEMPELVRIQNRYGIFGVQVLGAAADAPAAAGAVAQFAERQRINFPVLLGATTAQMRSLGLGVALPATAVIDGHGHVVERIPGVFERAKLEATLDRMVRRDADPSGAEGRAHDHARTAHVSRVREKGAPPASLVPS